MMLLMAVNKENKSITFTVTVMTAVAHVFESCTICLEDCDCISDVRVSKCCRRKFHQQCIKEWIETTKHSTCPDCRAKVTLDNYQPCTVQRVQPVQTVQTVQPSLPGKSLPTNHIQCNDADSRLEWYKNYNSMNMSADLKFALGSGATSGRELDLMMSELCGLME